MYVGIIHLDILINKWRLCFVKLPLNSSSSIRYFQLSIVIKSMDYGARRLLNSDASSVTTAWQVTSPLCLSASIT